MQNGDGRTCSVKDEPYDHYRNPVRRSSQSYWRGDCPQVEGNDLPKVIWNIYESQLDYSSLHSHLVVLNLPALDLKNNDYAAVIYFHNKEQHEHASNVAHNRTLPTSTIFKESKTGLIG